MTFSRSERNGLPFAEDDDKCLHDNGILQHGGNRPFMHCARLRTWHGSCLTGSGSLQQRSSEVARMDKPPCTKPGTPMNWCARNLRNERIEGRMTLPTEWWNGWRICKGKLIGPGGMTFTPQLLGALHRLENLRARARRKRGITQNGLR